MPKLRPGWFKRFALSLGKAALRLFMWILAILSTELILSFLDSWGFPGNVPFL